MRTVISTPTGQLDSYLLYTLRFCKVLFGDKNSDWEKNKFENQSLQLLSAYHCQISSLKYSFIFITFPWECISHYYHVWYSNLFTCWANAMGRTMFPTIQNLYSHHSTQAPLASIASRPFYMLSFPSFLSLLCLLKSHFFFRPWQLKFSLKTSSSILGLTHLTPSPCYPEFPVSTSWLRP